MCEWNKLQVETMDFYLSHYSNILVLCSKCGGPKNTPVLHAGDANRRMCEGCPDVLAGGSVQYFFSNHQACRLASSRVETQLEVACCRISTIANLPYMLQ
jgi:hypothetical protein